jgi:hypothetical protein
MPCICLLLFTHRRALYFLGDPSGQRLRLYVHMRSRYLFLGGRLILGMNLKVFMSSKPSIYGPCASMIFLRLPVVSFVRVLVHLDFAFTWREMLDSGY